MGAAQPSVFFGQKPKTGYRPVTTVADETQVWYGSKE
jgi:hypothetical protein